MPRKILLLGAPVDCGKPQPGCLMGPDALRTAALAEVLDELGYDVEDRGNLTPDAAAMGAVDTASPAWVETIGWTASLAAAADAACDEGLPIFLGGDHSLSMGSVAGVAAAAARQGRPQFVLWLDAHADLHSPETSHSGNLHGMPLAYVTGRSGFDGFPRVAHPIPDRQICLIGLRSVDPAERALIARTAFQACDMREIDEDGIAAPLRRFLDQVAAARGALHVSFDVDFLDPGIAPGVVTTVPGGTTFREAHLVMELLHESELVTSLDLVELNPFLDDRGRTATLMVDLVASLFGRKIFDRPTRPALERY